jgi:hypothetical protein
MTFMAEAIQKPYPNYHAARIKAPNLFARIRVLQTTKEGIMIYGGPLKTDSKGSPKTQAIRFPKDKFSVKEARAWLKEHKYSVSLFEPATEKTKKRWPTILGESR